MTTREKMVAALRAWRKAADRGYGERDHSRRHMEVVDARIRKLKAKYEALADQVKNEERQHNPKLPRGKWIKGAVKIGRNGKIQFRKGA